MRRGVDVLILVALLGAAAYFGSVYQAQVRVLASQIEAKVAPCQSPVSYSLGSIDARFRISTSTLVADLQQAEAIWEKPSGKNLLQYDATSGDVTVNFVYDYRQKATDQMAASGIQVTKSKASYDLLKARYDALAAAVVSEKAQFEQNVAAYQQNEAAYNAEVGAWNGKGGAPPAEYARLQEEKAVLATEEQSIEAEQNTVNADVDTQNALGTSLNLLIAQLNLNVDTYNQAGSSTGSEFEEGEYVSGAGLREINIYEYSDHDELVRVLAHEMGHALGLAHVTDPNAIMYKVNQGTALTATAADIAELNSVCTATLF